MLHVPFLGALAALPADAPAGPDLTRYFLVCGGLLLLILGVAHVFRRAFGRALAARAARRSLRVVDVLPLGGAKRLVVVSCYERVFLIGQGEKELCSIAELEGVEASVAPAAPTPPAAGREGAFEEHLESLVPAARREAAGPRLEPGGILG